MLFWNSWVLQVEWSKNSGARHETANLHWVIPRAANQKDIRTLSYPGSIIVVYRDPPRTCIGCSLRVCFSWSSRTKPATRAKSWILDQCINLRTSQVLSLSPTNQDESQSLLTVPTDLQSVQNQLLGKEVIATFDVVRISTRAGQDHCASETLRVLEDDERQKYLLYYAHKMQSKSATTSSGFIEWTRKYPCLRTQASWPDWFTVNDFDEIKKVDKKTMRLLFRQQTSLPRRSTIGSIDSVLSHDSTSGEDTQSHIMHRIKALDCVFYDQEGMLTWNFIRR